MESTLCLGLRSHKFGLQISLTRVSFNAKWKRTLNIVQSQNLPLAISFSFVSVNCGTVNVRQQLCA